MTLHPWSLPRMSGTSPTPTRSPLKFSAAWESVLNHSILRYWKRKKKKKKNNHHCIKFDFFLFIVIVIYFFIHMFSFHFHINNNPPHRSLRGHWRCLPMRRWWTCSRDVKVKYFRSFYRLCTLARIPTGARVLRIWVMVLWSFCRFVLLFYLA
jgi:hypothetical protein